MKTNKLFIFIITLQILSCFLIQEVNLVAARFTSLASFFALAALVGERVLSSPEGPVAALKDREILIALAGCMVAMINLFVIGSNKGAFLTAADLLLACVCLGFFELTRGEKLFVCSVGAVLLIWWYCTVRWYFNFNMAGMIFMLTGILSMLLMELIMEGRPDMGYLRFVQVIQYLTATLLCLLYHSRCVLAGMLAFGLLYLMLPLVCKSRVLKGMLVALCTAGSLLFTALYILMDRWGINITILYKDVLSGRQHIWKELWEAFGAMPLTGIGSSYHLKSFFIFEVHNGLFDILAVHGIIVFAAVMVLLVKRLYEALGACGSVYDRLRLAAAFSMLLISFFENFFINSPYLLLFMFFLAPGRKKEVKNET